MANGVDFSNNQTGFAQVLEACGSFLQDSAGRVSSYILEEDGYVPILTEGVGVSFLGLASLQTACIICKYALSSSEKQVDLKDDKITILAETTTGVYFLFRLPTITVKSAYGLLSNVAPIK